MQFSTGIAAGNDEDGDIVCLLNEFFDLTVLGRVGANVVCHSYTIQLCETPKIQTINLIYSAIPFLDVAFYSNFRLNAATYIQRLNVFNIDAVNLFES